MFKEFNNLSDLQKIVIVLIVIAIVYLIYKRSETLDAGSKIVFTNKPNNNLDATQLKQQEIPAVPLLYNRDTGIVTAASEFIGLPDEILPAWGSESVANYGKIDRLDDGYNGSMGLNYNMCSKSCCGPQYPPPFNLEEDEMVNKFKDKFVPNNYSCNNAWNNTGCVCMTEKQRDYIQSRGGNGN